MMDHLKGVTALTIDLDGTLADTRGLKLRMWPSLLQDPRVVLTWPKVVEAMRGRRTADLRAACVDELALRLGRPAAEVDRSVGEHIDRRWAALYRHAAPPPGLARLMAEARARGMPIAIVSDYPALDKLEAMALPAGQGVDLVIDCRALGALKPAPDGLLAAAALLGHRPGALLHVGDRWETDGLAAAAAGARFLHIDALHR